LPISKLAKLRYKGAGEFWWRKLSKADKMEGVGIVDYLKNGILQKYIK
jgi:hypothetical protein